MDKIFTVLMGVKLLFLPIFQELSIKYTNLSWKKISDNIYYINILLFLTNVILFIKKKNPNKKTKQKQYIFLLHLAKVKYHYYDFLNVNHNQQQYKKKKKKKNPPNFNIYSRSIKLNACRMRRADPSTSVHLSPTSPEDPGLASERPG